MRRLVAVSVLVLAACADAPTAVDRLGATLPSLNVFADQGTGVEVNNSFDAPSTNELNMNQQVPGRIGQPAPYVVWDGIDVGEVTLRFVNPAPGLAFFEYRIDGQTVGTNPHPVVSGDVVHPGVGVASGTETQRTLQADGFVEVRLALGGERDWDFDWTLFEVPNSAEARDACKDGGWQELGFTNQGLCIRWANTGK